MKMRISQSSFNTKSLPLLYLDFSDIFLRGCNEDQNDKNFIQKEVFYEKISRFEV